MYIEKVATFGLGYLVYKGFMTELAKTPDNGGVTVKAGQLLGWETPQQFEEGLKLWAGLFGDPKELLKRGEYAKMYDTLARKETITGGQWDWGIPTEDWGSLQRPAILFPEGFELVGPSRTGITRPKGLD